jgi:hypothetical protein
MVLVLGKEEEGSRGRPCPADDSVLEERRHGGGVPCFSMFRRREDFHTITEPVSVFGVSASLFHDQSPHSLLSPQPDSIVEWYGRSTFIHCLNATGEATLHRTLVVCFLALTAQRSHRCGSCLFGQNTRINAHGMASLNSRYVADTELSLCCRHGNKQIHGLLCWTNLDAQTRWFI